MSISLIQEQINRFLANDEPVVIAIKGQWGVGKTYSWNSFLRDAKERDEIKFERYSYVSLFGLNSLDALKYSIFENAIPKTSIGLEPSIKSFQDNAKSVSEGIGRKSLGFIKSFPYVKNVAPILESLTFLSLKEMIICIDDLERKGLGLSLKDVLGLVSLLKEQKKCKVFLLLNDGTNDTKDYETYKEKVIDIEFAFKPTSYECAQIAYDGLKDFHVELRDLTSKFDITNIRILKKIERLIDDVYPLAKDADESIFNSIMHSIVLFSWCYYCFNENELVPSLPFIEDEEFMFYGAFDQKKDNDPKKLAWKDVLNKHGYYLTSALDLILINAVKDGFLNEEYLKREIDAEIDKFLKGKSSENFTTAWRLYHDSFDNNEKEVLESLYHSFLDNYKTINPNSLDALVCFLREFGEHKKASEIIEVYVNGRSDEVELFDRTSLSLFEPLVDDELVERFNDLYYEGKLKRRETPSEVLLRISNDNSWNNDDVEYLCGIYVEDYYDVFKTIRGDDLYKVVKGSLLFGELSDGCDKYKTIDEKVKWALTIISYESEINRKRVRKFFDALD